MSKPRVTDCPTPRKAAYPTRRRALLILERLPSKGISTEGYRVYRCGCGSYHISSKPLTQRAYKEIVRKLSAAPASPYRRPRPRSSQPWEPVRVAVDFRAAKRPRCRRCGRSWLSDLDTTGRRCPNCDSEMPQRRAA